MSLLSQVFITPRAVEQIALRGWAFGQQWCLKLTLRPDNKFGYAVLDAREAINADVVGLPCDQGLAVIMRGAEHHQQAFLLDFPPAFLDANNRMVPAKLS